MTQEHPFLSRIAPGDILKIVVYAVLVVWGYVHLSDVQVQHDQKLIEMQHNQEKQSAVIQQMQLDMIRNSTILSGVTNDLAKLENKIDSKQ